MTPGLPAPRWNIRVLIIATAWLLGLVLALLVDVHAQIAAKVVGGPIDWFHAGVVAFLAYLGTNFVKWIASFQVNLDPEVKLLINFILNALGAALAGAGIPAVIYGPILSQLAGVLTPLLLTGISWVIHQAADFAARLAGNQGPKAADKIRAKLSGAKQVA